MDGLQPFAAGDRFVTASQLDESARFPTGQGRIVQFDAQWRQRGAHETGRTGLISALVLDPAIVMFDEPDSGLDPVRTALLCELIKEVHAESGGCYMVISHDLGTARRIADFIAVLWKGRIVESGPKEELFESDNEFVHQFLQADVVGPLAMD